MKSRSYRYKYPVHDRPTLFIGRDAMSVIDISESGIKIKASKRFKPKIRQVYDVTIQFLSGHTHTTQALVVRVTHDLCSFYLRDLLTNQIFQLESEYLAQRNKSFVTKSQSQDVEPDIDFDQIFSRSS